MSGADSPALILDGRLRAALLWDVPALHGYPDDGARQWFKVLKLDLVNFGELDEGDVLSVAAHVVFSNLSDDADRAGVLRAALMAKEGPGALFECLLGLALGADSAGTDLSALHRTLPLVEAIADPDLRA